jgi:hypothetical protein
MADKNLNRYSRLIEEIFFKYYRPGMAEVPFERTDIETAAAKLEIVLPKNLGDVIYSFRYRTQLPESITSEAREGSEWIIVPTGRAKYRFELSKDAVIVPRDNMAVTKIPDSTPGVIIRYALDDEQSLLAKIRYNRLIDIFTGVTCYSLQNHLRTTAPGIGQVETDEIYIGIDKRGVHYVFPVQAKSGSGKIGTVQIRQDYAVCATKLPELICRPIAAQYASQGVIALLEFEQTDIGIQLSIEKHYKLVHPDDLSPEELMVYRKRPE